MNFTCLIYPCCRQLVQCHPDLIFLATCSSYHLRWFIVFWHLLCPPKSPWKFASVSWEKSQRHVCIVIKLYQETQCWANVKQLETIPWRDTEGLTLKKKTILAPHIPLDPSRPSFRSQWLPSCGLNIVCVLCSLNQVQRCRDAREWKMPKGYHY